MKDYKGLNIYGTKNQFDDWYDQTQLNQSDDSDELDIAFEDDEDYN